MASSSKENTSSGPSIEQHAGRSSSSSCEAGPHPDHSSSQDQRSALQELQRLLQLWVAIVVKQPELGASLAIACGAETAKNTQSDRRWKEIVVVLIERVILETRIVLRTCQTASLSAISRYKYPVLKLNDLSGFVLPVWEHQEAANPSRCGHWDDVEQKSARYRYGSPQGSLARCTLCQEPVHPMQDPSVWVCYPDL
jgi:hypothetical protein